MVEIDTSGIAVSQSDTDSKSKGGSRTRRIEQLHDGAVEIMFTFLDDADKNELPAFDSKAEELGLEIDEEVREELDLDDGIQYYSFESLFQADIGHLDYFGNPKRNRHDDGSTSIPEKWSKMTGDGKLIKDSKVALNGNHYQDIQSRFSDKLGVGEGEEVEIAVGMGDSDSHDDPLEQRQYFTFWIRSTDATVGRNIEAREEVNELTADEADKERVRKGILDVEDTKWAWDDEGENLILPDDDEEADEEADEEDTDEESEE